MRLNIRGSAVVEVKVWVDGSRAYCSIRDWGIGIPADEVAKIFDRFYRARTATGIAGTGIGLNFAQKIMHLHGGTSKSRVMRQEVRSLHSTSPWPMQIKSSRRHKGACQR